MPITQQRMLDVLDEAESLADFARGLRADLLGILDSPMGDASKFEAISALLDASPLPLCVRCAIERDHFRRAGRRNVRSAARMAKKRQHPEATTEGERHGLD